MAVQHFVWVPLPCWPKRGILLGDPLDGGVSVAGFIQEGGWPAGSPPLAWLVLCVRRGIRVVAMIARRRGSQWRSLDRGAEAPQPRALPIRTRVWSDR